MIQLFTVDQAKIKPTEHCYIIAALKRIMDEYPEDYLSIYAYLFYKSCLNEDLNPFANVPEAEKDDFILEQVGGEFSLDDPVIDEALQVVIKLYETPTYRLYRSIKTSIERLADYLETTAITEGRDGNINAVMKAQEKFNDIRRSFKDTYKDFKEEQSTTSRGGNQIAYDQG